METTARRPDGGSGALVDAGTPDTTKRARQGALRYFAAWAGLMGVPELALPISPELILRFIVDHLEGEPSLDQQRVEQELVARGLRRKVGPVTVATVEARVSHLATAHRLAGLEANPCRDPRIVEALKAARKLRTRTGGQRVKAAVTRDVLDTMLSECGTDVAGVRDRALLLVGFGSGGRRRSELTRATVEDLRKVDGSFLLNIPYSKADQEGVGFEVPIAGRAAEALRRWLEVSGISSGAIFRRVSKGGKVLGEKGLSGEAIRGIVRRRAEQAGHDPDQFGGHSLRAGFITEGAGRGVPLPELMLMSGHRSITTAQRYYRGGAALHNQAARLAG